MKHTAPDKIWLTPQFADAASVIGGGVYHVNLSDEDRKDCIQYVRADLHESQVKLLGELVEALGRYSDHSDRCAWWDNPLFQNCDCGYADLLTRARKVQESHRERVG